MQVGTISFCDKTGYNIKSNEVKDTILKTLETVYDIKIIRRHSNLFRKGDEVRVNNHPYSMCLRTNGNPYFLLLTKLNFQNTCIFIDKKVQHGYYQPRMIITSFHLDDSLFEKETVLDGEMVKDDNGVWVFLIHDMIVHMGKHLGNVPILQRNQMLHVILNDQLYSDYDDVCQFQVKRFFKVSEMKEMIDEFMPLLPYTCRGIYFKPYFLKFKDIYFNFDNSNIKSVVREKYTNTFNMIGDVEKKLNIANGSRSKPKPLPVSMSIMSSKQTLPENIKEKEGTIKDGEERHFYIEKTSTQDVYHLYDMKTNAFVDNACVPSMKVSKFLQVSFGNSAMVVKLPIVAQFSTRFDRWIPKALLPL